MQRIMITSPFTGLEFEALEYADGRIVATNAITGHDIQITYNPSIKKYMLPKEAFKHVALLTMEETAELLDVSKARVSVLVKQGRLNCVRPGAVLYLTKESVLDYKCKVQREKRKADDDGAGID